MNKYRTSLQNEKRQKQEDIKDPAEQEKTLKENLETMTQIAQKLDIENRNLVEKNQELDINFKSQDKDKDLLLK